MQPRTFKWISLCTLFLYLTACNPPKVEDAEKSLPTRWPNAVTYEIFVQSFYDSNGDGIGDIKGMTSKLDYLQDLGVEAVWLMPVNPSPSYHKYDVTDYYDIHPDYGTLEDFKEFVNQANSRGIQVVMDLVINHCSSKHPWFIDAMNPEGKYRDYFVWQTMEEIEQEGSLLKEKTGDSDNIRQWNEVKGQDQLYFSYFYGGMPDLNYDNPAVREEVFNIGKFWLTEVGVNGFRLDAAKHIFPDHRAEDNHAFWSEFYAQMKTYNPDVYMVGEVWSDLATQTPYARGFSALFNFDMAFTILETVKNEKSVTATIYKSAWKVNEGESPVALFNESDSAFKSLNGDFLNTTFLTNHDQNRAMSFLANDSEKAKLAASILLTLPGAPYLYYGEEIGMRGMKPDELIREPFLWGANDKGAATWIEAEFSTPNTIAPLADQLLDSGSIYHHYRTLIRLRRTSEALTYGDASAVDLGDEEVLAFIRAFEQDEVMVYHNLSKQIKQVTVPQKYTNLLFSNFQADLSSEDLTIPPFKSIILTTKNN